MVLIAGICDSCGCSSEHLKRVHRGGRSQLCGCCDGWVRMSLRRTRRVPLWIRPPSNMGRDEIAEMRERFQRLRGQNANGVGRWAERRMIFEMGFSYLGPLNERAWGLALQALELQEHVPTEMLPDLSNQEMDEEFVKLEKAGIIYRPTTPALRRQITHLLQGNLGPANKRRFNTALFLWLIGDDEFRGRDAEAWALSFQFLQEVVEDLGDRAEFVDDYIRVIGSSGNIYRIRPRPHPPFYVVSREVVEQGAVQHPTICIDPINAHTVVFGDVLVNLVLALYDDHLSARHIDTLSRHVFGDPHADYRGRRRRNVNIEHLWRRALGRMPDEEQPDPREMFQQWRRVIDRFQTNLADWEEMEEEE